MGDLLRAGVLGDHPVEVPGKRKRSLPVAGGAIPGKPARRGHRGKVGEQRIGIAGTMACVCRRLFRKIVFVVHYGLLRWNILSAPFLSRQSHAPPRIPSWLETIDTSAGSSP